MATKTLALTLPADYTTLGAATAGAAAGDTISIIEPGTYPDTVATFKAGQQVVNNSGGTVVFSDVAARVTYMLTLAANVAISGVTIAYGSNFARCVNLGINSGVSLTDCILRATGAAVTWFAIGNGAEGLTMTRCTTAKTGAGLAFLKYWGGVSTGTWTLTDCDLTTAGASSGGVWYYPPRSVIMFRCRSTYKLWYPADANSTFAAVDCRATAANEPLAASFAGIAAGAVSLTNCGQPDSTGYLFTAANGSTVASLTAVNCYSARGCTKTGTGTWTVGAGGNNSYVTSTLVLAGDVVVINVAAWRLGADGVPSPGSSLDSAGAEVTGRDLDLLRNPSRSGGRMDIGPVQRQKVSPRRSGPVQIRNPRRDTRWTTW